MQQKSDLTTAEETFYSQAELIMQIAVESAVSVLQRSDIPLTQAAGGGNSQTQLTAVLAVMSKEAVRKICSVFRELYMSVAMENKALKEKVRLLECGKPQNPKTHAALCSSAPFPVTLTIPPLQQPITSQSRLFLYHQRQHTGDRPHVCAVCDKGFLLASQLKQHELLHTGVKPHRCSQCNKEFRTPQNYHRHLLVHSGEKPYQCTVCSRRFRQSNQLKSHMQIHTGIKLYSCQRCQQGFSDSRQLKKHRCGEDSQDSIQSTVEQNKQRDVLTWTPDFSS